MSQKNLDIGAYSALGLIVFLVFIAIGIGVWRTESNRSDINDIRKDVRFIVETLDDTAPKDVKRSIEEAMKSVAENRWNKDDHQKFHGEKKSEEFLKEQYRNTSDNLFIGNGG